MSVARKMFVAFFLLLLIILAFSGLRLFFAVRRGREVLRPSEPYRREMKNPESSVLVVGDSTAAGVGSFMGGVPYFISKEFPNTSVITRASSGRKLSDINSSLFQGEFDAVIIMAGGNDILKMTNSSEVERQLRKVLELAGNSSDEIILLHSGNIGLAPAFSFPIDLYFSWRTRKVREVFIRVSKETDATYIDLYTDRSNDPFRENTSRYYSSDGLHLSDEGYRVWFQEIMNQSDLESALRK